MEESRIYDNICKKTKKVEISINELEKRAHISTGSIYKWNTVSPTIRNIKKVADILNCSIEDLLPNKK